jgi:site-specific DNA-adenine methylase
MTCYHGGKQLIGKEIATIINAKGKDFNYAEPFCGMLSVFNHIETRGQTIISDQNADVIQMWQEAAHNNWEPPHAHLSESDYNILKQSSSPSALRGFVGHHYSYGGTFFGSYRFKSSPICNIETTIKKVKQIAAKLSYTSIVAGDYKALSDLTGFIIYCDPPYKGTRCNYKDSFDNETFLDWCEFMEIKGNKVFVSEYEINRPNFIEIASFEKQRGSYQGRRPKRPELLFEISV